MQGLAFKTLTFFAVLLVSFSSSLIAQESAVLKSETFKTHFRLNIFTEKDQVYVNKVDNTVQIQTLDFKTYQHLEAQFKETIMPSQYIEEIEASKKNFPQVPATITIKLKSSDIEMFSFYRDREKRYIVDFWSNKSNELNQKISEVENKKIPQKNPEKSKNKTSTVVAPKKAVSLFQRVSPKIKKELNLAEKNAIKEKNDPGYRDFRYGLSLVWDYPALSPEVKTTLNLERKTPDALYPIKDKNIDVDEKEAHMQLTINMYRKKKWGLLNKSINLYEKKYGDSDSHKDENDFLRANALLKKHINDTDETPKRVATNLLDTIASRSNNYELQKAIYLYLMDYKLQKKDHLNLLKYAQKLYVLTRENFDHEIAENAANTILYSLAQLGQSDKIKAFASEKSIRKLVPVHRLLAYQLFIALRSGDSAKVIKEYEKVEKSLQKPILPSILFNVAEAYFRNSQYDKAIKHYDQFVSQYSHLAESGKARLRIALCYDITSRGVDKVLELYQNALNRTPDPKTRYEAKLRFVGLAYARKKKLEPLDEEKLIFLETDPAEKKEIDRDIKNALWLVRMRTLISKEKYREALFYLNAIPIKSLKPVERRMFTGDGAEIIYGLMKDSFSRGKYSEVVKIWERYRNIYDSKIALDPFVNSLVCQSYLQLGLNESFKRSLEYLTSLRETPERVYPIWVERSEQITTESLIRELDILKSMADEKYNEVNSKLAGFIEKNPEYYKAHYYQGLSYFKQKKYSEAKSSFETYLLKANPTKELTYLELGELFSGYIDSLYRMGDPAVFKDMAVAMIKDIKKIKNPTEQIKSSIERAEYLYIEIIAGESTPQSYLLLETISKQFLDEYSQTIYQHRMKYLLGMAKIKNKRKEEGTEILNGLIQDESTSSYIKELSKTELASLQFKSSQL